MHGPLRFVRTHLAATLVIASMVAASHDAARAQLLQPKGNNLFVSVPYLLTGPVDKSYLVSAGDAFALKPLGALGARLPDVLPEYSLTVLGSSSVYYVHELTMSFLTTGLDISAIAALGPRPVYGLSLRYDKDSFLRYTTGSISTAFAKAGVPTRAPDYLGDISRNVERLASRWAVVGLLDYRTLDWRGNVYAGGVAVAHLTKLPSGSAVKLGASARYMVVRQGGDTEVGFPVAVQVSWQDTYPVRDGKPKRWRHEAGLFGSPRDAFTPATVAGLFYRFRSGGLLTAGANAPEGWRSYLRRSIEVMVMGGVGSGRKPFYGVRLSSALL